MRFTAVNLAPVPPLLPPAIHCRSQPSVMVITIVLSHEPRDRSEPEGGQCEPNARLE